MHPRRGSERTAFGRICRMPRRRSRRASRWQIGQCFGRPNLWRLKNGQIKFLRRDLHGWRAQLESRPAGRSGRVKTAVTSWAPLAASALNEGTPMAPVPRKTTRIDDGGQASTETQMINPDGLLRVSPAGPLVDPAIPRSRCRDSRRSLCRAGRATDVRAQASLGRISCSKARKRGDSRTVASSSPREIRSPAH